MPDLILNELSFQNWEDPQTGFACRDRHEARTLMQRLIDTMRASGRFGSISRPLRTQNGFLEYQLADGYTLSQWRNDPDVDRDARRFLGQRGAIAFFLEDTMQFAAERSEMTEVKIAGRQGYALCAAWLLHGICISLQSHSAWNISSLGVNVTALSADGSLRSETAAVRNVSHPDHFTDHEEWILASQISSILNGRELVAQAATAYPAIEICEGAEAQILALTGTERHFKWVLEAFAAGNREMLAWKGGPFPHHKLPGPASGESPSVRNSQRLMSMRSFTNRSAEKLLFEHHMKHRGQNIRMHYRVDSERRLLMIGYVGEHLPTALY